MERQLTGRARSTAPRCLPAAAPAVSCSANRHRCPRSGGVCAGCAIPVQASEPPGPPACEFCPAELGEVHRHLLDLDAAVLRCACPGCLRGSRRYRPVPRRARRLADFVLDDLAWLAFGAPVGLVFFARDPRTGRIAAHYPSPAGTATAAVDAESWAVLAGPNPQLAALESRVLGLLVDRLGEPPEHWLLPLDRFHRLGARLRGAVSPEALGDRVAGFLAELR